MFRELVPLVSPLSKVAVSSLRDDFNYVLKAYKIDKIDAEGRGVEELPKLCVYSGPQSGYLEVMTGEFVLLYLVKGQKGILHSWNHGPCQSLSIKARDLTTNKTVIGHAHIHATEFMTNVYQQYQWVLAYLANPVNNLTDVQIVLALDNRLAGFPDDITIELLEQEARDKGFTVLPTVIREGEVLPSLRTDTIETKEEVALRTSRMDEPPFSYDLRRWISRAPARKRFNPMQYLFSLSLVMVLARVVQAAVSMRYLEQTGLGETVNAFTHFSGGCEIM
jgi:hypothetical protein